MKNDRIKKVKNGIMRKQFQILIENDRAEIKSKQSVTWLTNNSLKHTQRIQKSFKENLLPPLVAYLLMEWSLTQWDNASKRLKALDRNHRKKITKRELNGFGNFSFLS